MKKFSNDIPYLYEHNGFYLYRRSIPPRFRNLAKREFKKSLKTKCDREAILRYAEADYAFDNYYQALLRGDTFRSRMEHSAYIAKARSQGRELLDFNELSANPYALINTFEQSKRANLDDPHVFHSFYNALADDIHLSKLVDSYEKREAYSLQSKTDNERRKKLNTKHRAVKVLIDHLGKDKLVSEVTKQDAETFFEMLESQVIAGNTKPNTANKHIIAIRTLIAQHNVKYGRKKFTHFDNMRFKDKRSAAEGTGYTIKHIKEKWLTGDPFKGMNQDAKNLLFAMMDTGCGFKELCGLKPEDIRLDDPIPHIVIKPNENRQLKTDFRDRSIPLIGFALQVFRDSPNGFGRYSTPTGPDNASNTIRKYLNENGLNESDNHSPYSLRHLFKTRLREHDIAEETQNKLMGHQHQGMGPQYGKLSLNKLYEAMKKIEGDFL